MKCPQCNGECWRDEVDIGVGVQCGPWRCNDCGWGEEDASADITFRVEEGPPINQDDGAA